MGPIEDLAAAHKARTAVQDLAKFLRITSAVVAKEGGQINVGETFTLRVTVKNMSPGGISEVVFKNAALVLVASPFAEKVGTAPDTFPDVFLRGGESSSLDFKLKAVQAIPLPTMVEKIGDVVVFADIDVERLFHVGTEAHRVMVDLRL